MSVGGYQGKDNALDKLKNLSTGNNNEIERAEARGWAYGLDDCRHHLAITLGIENNESWINLLRKVAELKVYKAWREQMKPATEEEFVEAMSKLKDVIDRAPDSTTEKYWKSDHKAWDAIHD